MYVAPSAAVLCEQKKPSMLIRPDYISSRATRLQLTDFCISIFQGPSRFRRSSSMNDSAKIEIFTDGECPLCKWMRARVEPFDTRNRLRWLNFRDPEVLEMAAPRAYEELNSEMHAHMPDGRWLKGYPAWLEVLRFCRNGAGLRLSCRCRASHRSVAFSTGGWRIDGLHCLGFRHLARPMECVHSQHPHQR